MLLAKFKIMKKLPSKDPSGHIKIAVSNSAKSKKFYKKLFEFLSYKKIAEKEDSIAYCSCEGFGIWIKQAKQLKPAYQFFAPGLHHLCFKAKNKKQVDELYNFLIKNKIKIFDSPEHYPEYTPEYYAVFFADPDGIKLELAWY